MDKQELFVEPVSLDLAFSEPAENLRRIEAAVSERLARAPAAAPGSRLFLFPELALTGFVTKQPRAFDLEGSDPVIEGLRRLAVSSRAVLAVGLPELNRSDPGRPFNSLALIGSEGELLASYRKLHLFTLGTSPESACYSSGEAGTLLSYRGWRIGLSICFDLRFPGLYHEYARSAADLILAPACWVGGAHKSYQFKTLGSAHAILSQAYLASVNRSGRDPAFEYDGSAYVFSPFGENLFEGAACRLDPSELESCRRLSVRPADRPAYPVQAHSGE